MNRKEIMLMDPANSLMMADDDDFFTVFPSPERSLKIAGVTTMDKGAAFEIAVKTPGFEKNDLKVGVKNGVLKVEGARKEKRRVGTAGGWSETRSESSFTRNVPLPDGVEVKKTQIRYTNGELRLTLPKSGAYVRK